MKVGTENRKKAQSAIVLLACAALTFFLEQRTPTATHAVNKTPMGNQQGGATATTRPHADHHYVAYLLKPTLDPHLRVDLLAGSESVKYEGNGRDIFAAHKDEIPQPVAPGLLADAKPDPPPPPPPPPPINLKFWGWANQPGETKAVFLAMGETAFIAHEGEIVARRYRVVRITLSSVEIEDLLSNNRQSLPVAF